MTEHERASQGPVRPATSEDDTVPEHDPYYCVHDPETGEWLVALKHLPGYLRDAIFEKTEGPDVPEDWQELRGPNWAIHILHLQAEEGSEESKRILADNTAALPMPEGWDKWVEEHARPGEPDTAPDYHPEYSSEAIPADETGLRRDSSGSHVM